MQMKITTKGHYTFMRMMKGIIILEVTIPHIGKNAEKQYHSQIADGNVKLYRHSGKELGSFSCK